MPTNSGRLGRLMKGLLNYTAGAGSGADAIRRPQVRYGTFRRAARTIRTSL